MTASYSDIANVFVSRLESGNTPEAIRELAALIIDARLERKIDEILLEISREYTRRFRIVEAEARSPYPLSDQIKKKLAEHVKNQTDARKVIIHEEIDKSLLGGVILSGPDVELDASIKSRLAKLGASK